MSLIDDKKIKSDFPILNRKIGDKPLVYLDNAATSQKPKSVIDAEVDYYSNHNANVHRGIHTLSEEATEMYEKVREKTAQFINARSSHEIIFTKGTTESLNFISTTLGNLLINEGDIVMTTPIEHHSNMVPWQILCERKKAVLEFIEVSPEGEPNLKDFEHRLASANGLIKIIAVTHASNVLGTIFPLREISHIAHKHGALVVVDGAQAIPHVAVNVQTLDVDAYTFSAHKMLGPTGVGVLWAKEVILKKIEPYQFGGGMIEDVDLQKSTWAAIPERFEAGTPNVAGVVGFGAAIDYLSTIGMDNIAEHEQELSAYAFAKIGTIEGIRIYGPKGPTQRTGLISFTFHHIHPHDIAAVLNSEGVAVRSGHHCAFPLHKKLDLTATVRASYYLYNTKQDIDKLAEGILKALKILGNSHNQ